MDRPLHTMQTVAVVVVLLLAVLFGQALADASVSASTIAASSANTGEVLGRASFAYLTGIRVFAAQVLWNRLEPVLHEYYGGVALRDQTYVLTTFNMITLLDPQFEQTYYIGPWILAQRGSIDQAISLAKQGVENVPNSGLLRASYAQILLLHGDDLEAAVEQTDIAVSDSVVWVDAIEQHDAYGVLRSVYMRAGMQKEADEVLRVIEQLDAQIGDQLPAQAHDHDGDGEPDH